jgi:uncharacterized protein YecT (DUF1311 family)
VEPDAQQGVQRAVQKINPTILALGGLLALLLLVWFFSSNRSADQDKLTGPELNEVVATSSEKRCSSKATYDLIKRELFRRAAQLRGNDQSVYDRLAAFAVLRMENPVMESEDKDSGAINCSGSLFLDLPPGVAVVGGRQSLAGNIEYTLQPAADGSGDVALIRNIDSIVAPLATLARVGQPEQPVDTNAVAPSEVDPLAPLPPAEPAVPVTDGRPIGARPSFDCANARTRGETEVCADAGLATLDRQMAAQYGRAFERASAEQRRLLQQTRDRFLTYRDRCPNRACIGDSYTGRMREIRDIMEGRWQPPR